MHANVRNALAVVVGLVVGSIVNMGIVGVGGVLVPLPAGANTETIEGLRAAMPTLEPKHFLMPFLAHALGTLVGASVAARMAASHAMRVGVAIGGIFLVMGTVMVAMVGGPAWFIAADLLLAYLPMGWLGGKFASHSSAAKPA